jgi:magnesium transporter
MSVNILEVSKEGLNIISSEKFADRNTDHASAFIYNIVTTDQQEALDELAQFDLNQNILDDISKPEANIRFKIMDNITYGELAYFTSRSQSKAKYMGVIVKNNLLILIHEYEDVLAKEIKDGLTDSIQLEQDQINVFYIVYILIQVIMADYGKLILSYREEIEDLARDFDKKLEEIEPDDFLDAKSQLSDFSRVFEQIHYTLNFPPVKGLLARKTEVQTYFSESLKTINILQISLSKAEERLNSLHDHYLLLLQDKSNRRINFLTIIQAIFVPLTLLAGIYGMNFEFMPELKLESAYFITLGSMGFIAIGFLLYFYKNKWFD